jgi:flagellar hook-associated protein 3 FlgL
VGDTLSVQTTMPGDNLFNNAGASVLGALSQLASSLTTGNSSNIGNATGAVSAALTYLTSQHVVTGNAINQLNAQESYLSQEKITLSSQATSLVGIDSATAAENLVQAETQNSAVLAAAAKVLPNSLLNYLK